MQKFYLKQKNQKKRGFSLFELLIYISVLSIIVVVISSILISFSNSNARSQAISEVNSSVRFASELLRQDLKNASSISVPATGNSSSTLTLVRNGVTIVYDTASGILRRKEGAASAVNITNSNIVVGTPTFTRIENTNVVFNSTNISIKINMTFSYNSAVSTLVYSAPLEVTVNLY